MRIPTLEDRLAVREKPASSPVMFQTWSNLLFLHWEIDAQEIAKRIPDRLSVDLHEGKTYLGLVPFFMRKVRPRFLPTMPGLSNFLELNVRAYVHDERGQPGVWFFSLDCDQPIAVEVARKFFHLPYQHAQMSTEGSIYRCQRKNCEEKAVFDYEGSGHLQTAKPGSLEFFLLERYLLFSESRGGKIHCGQVHHSPYQFTKARVGKKSKAPLEWEKFSVGDEPISQLYSPGVPVSIHPLRSVN
ncbi:MAG: DUF2071 domain-containing protein [Verrucomicrobia bacterium]|nr:DUF2071 domain-containing protein [Verrucomicrobiota bacterium]